MAYLMSIENKNIKAHVGSWGLRFKTKNTRLLHFVRNDKLLDMSLRGALATKQS